METSHVMTISDRKQYVTPQSREIRIVMDMLCTSGGDALYTIQGENAGLEYEDL